VLLLLALAFLFLALARPQASVTELRREGTVVLAFDVSASMAATDLEPTRIEAAQAAARTFVDKQPAPVRIGVVAFSGSAVVTQQPTTDRARVLAAIDRLTPQGGTGLARGLQTALSSIVGRTVELREPEGEAGSVEPEGQDLGFHSSAAIVLLSDGENTEDPDPIDVAELASAAGVKIYPVGVGSPQGTVLDIDGFQVATALDERTLQDIATTTDGRYYSAADEAELAKVYDSIDLAWTTKGSVTEVTSLLAAAAALLLLAAVGLSLAWYGRVI
jgi:Ca-activated chloride channel family protein